MLYYTDTVNVKMLLSQYTTYIDISSCYRWTNRFDWPWLLTFVENQIYIKLEILKYAQAFRLQRGGFCVPHFYTLIRVQGQCWSGYIFYPLRYTSKAMWQPLRLWSLRVGWGRSPVELRGKSSTFGMSRCMTPRSGSGRATQIAVIFYLVHINPYGVKYHVSEFIIYLPPSTLHI